MAKSAMTDVRVTKSAVMKATPTSQATSWFNTARTVSSPSPEMPSAFSTTNAPPNAVGSSTLNSATSGKSAVRSAWRKSDAQGAGSNARAVRNNRAASTSRSRTLPCASGEATSATASTATAARVRRSAPCAAHTRARGGNGEEDEGDRDCSDVDLGVRVEGSRDAEDQRKQVGECQGSRGDCSVGRARDRATSSGSGRHLRRHRPRVAPTFSAHLRVLRVGEHRDEARSTGVGRVVGLVHSHHSRHRRTQASASAYVAPSGRRSPRVVGMAPRPRARAPFDGSSERRLARRSVPSGAAAPTALRAQHDLLEGEGVELERGRPRAPTYRGCRRRRAARRALAPR